MLRATAIRCKKPFLSPASYPGRVIAEENRLIPYAGPADILRAVQWGCRKVQKVWVYRFSYIDRQSGERRVADDFATEVTIAEIGAHILQETARQVDANTVGRAGYVIRDYSGTAGRK
jgi:hypothetical protein